MSGGPDLSDTSAVRALLCRELIGRDGALAAARGALADASRGSGGVLFVSGEAGVGKSRLVTELVSGARENGMQVLFGRAVQADVPVPFRPFSEALLSHFRSQGLPDLPELTPFRPALGRLLPEWRTAGEATHEPLVVLAEGVVRLLTAAAGPHGVLLVLEDIHWTDDETLSVLEYFADVLRTQPVLCVATLRPEGASRARRLVQGLQAARTATVVELDALPADELSRMTAACLDASDLPDEVVEFVRTWSDGLPFMVEEVLAGAVDAGALTFDGERWAFDTDAAPSLPVSFVDNVHGRLRGLGPDAARVLRFAAVLGRRFEWSLLPAAVALSELEVLAALRAGVDAQLLVVEAGGEFNFRHALTRDAVLSDLLHAELALVSRTLLDVVEAAHPGLPGYWCEAAAGLAERSGQQRARGQAAPRAGTAFAGGGRAGLGRATPRPRPRADRPTPPRRPTSTRSPSRCWPSPGRPRRRSWSAHGWPTSSGRSTPRRCDVPTRTWPLREQPSPRASGRRPRSTWRRARDCAAEAADERPDRTCRHRRGPRGSRPGSADGGPATGRTRPRDGRVARRPRARLRGVGGGRPVLEDQ